jgi:FkbM family methyltransferase
MLRYAMQTAMSLNTKRMLWRVVNHRFLHHPAKTVAIDRVGNSLICHTNQFLGRHLAVFGIWEPSLTNHLLSKKCVDGIFIDVGANIGYYSLLASRIFSQVISFEPSPATHALLSENVRRNGRKNIVLHQAAIADTEAIMDLYKTSDSGLSSLVVKSGMLKEASVRVAPLQSFLADSDWGRVRFIKIDVEGTESRVLDSIANCLSLLPRDVEISIELDGGPKSQELFRRMRALEFDAYDLNTTYSLDHYLIRAPQISSIDAPPSTFTDCLFRRS